MAAERTILRVGLTGNIGAGKSTVGAMMAAGGCLLIDADALARRVLAEPEARDAMVDAAGRVILDGEGAIDRAVLARRIFSDPALRRAVEAISHPRIRDLEEAEVAAWEVARGIAVTEAALLVETGGTARYDRLVVVVAPAPVRLERLVARGMERDDVRRRMAAQMDQAEKAAAADRVIDNGGSLERTREQVDELLEALRTELAGR